MADVCEDCEITSCMKKDSCYFPLHFMLTKNFVSTFFVSSIILPSFVANFGTGVPQDGVGHTLRCAEGLKFDFATKRPARRYSANLVG